MNNLVMLLLPSVLLVSVAHANDTAATINTSGVVIEKSDVISMEEEDLYLSRENIHVRYRFKNTSDKEVTTAVAFPLPTISMETPYRDVSFFEKGKPVEDPLHFKLSINGKVTPVKSKASYEPRSKNLEFKYYWIQTFPSKKEVVVEHSYRPAVGNGDLTLEDNWRRRYCVEENASAALTRIEKKIRAEAIKHVDYMRNQHISEEQIVHNYHHYNTFDRLNYVLKTGANWKGPIGKFKMVINKDEPSALVYLCWGNLEQTSPTTLTFEKERFVPSKDLSILFINDFDPKRHSGVW